MDARDADRESDDEENAPAPVTGNWLPLPLSKLFGEDAPRPADHRARRPAFNREQLLMELLAAEHSSEEPDDGELTGSACVRLLPGEVNAKLKSLVLSDDGKSVTGTVSVSKLAFGKWVAVWFTFDNWETKREVTTRYGSATTHHGGGVTTRCGRRVGVFTFSIGLDDFLNVTSKVMKLAVEYNNGGGIRLILTPQSARTTQLLEEADDSNVCDAVDQDGVEDVFT
ncbi:hypothetical protein B0H14DRAFT_2625337 [Mycena olivaceomarginata]|nr:hypothetical protein B0H14DRAFT_2625337 [Mycena olivaceomarginata]